MNPSDMIVTPENIWDVVSFGDGCNFPDDPREFGWKPRQTWRQDRSEDK